MKEDIPNSRSWKDILQSHSDIVASSKQVDKNYIFVAIVGYNVNGNDFIPDAISRGATLIITDDKIAYNTYKDVIKIMLVESARKTFAEILHAKYPNRPKEIFAVTGTNGKTSCTWYIRQISDYIFKKMHLKAKSASIGTLGVYLENEHIGDIGLTTFPADVLQSIMHDLATRSCKCIAIEASSIGIDQDRMWTIKCKAIGFTSFSHDHLDYHGDIETYLQSKLKGFAELLENNGLAVINASIPNISEITEYLKNIGVQYKTVDFYEQYNDADVQIIIRHVEPDYTIFDLSYCGIWYRINTPVVTNEQIINLVIAIVMLRHSCTFEMLNIIEAAQYLSLPLGRMEKVKNIYRPNVKIFIDYAHTPDALAKALVQMQNMRDNDQRIILVFGCGGDRDQLKRPIMGQIATSFSDIVIITDDNPRTENAELISQMIISKIDKQSLKKCTIIANRADAIQHAISIARDNDIVLIAGKGHEKYQTVGNIRYPFDDVQVAETCVP